MKKTFLPTTVIAITLVSIADFAHADIRLSRVFSDNMVLQREMIVPIWGWADPKQNLVVDFAGQKKMAIADEAGKWMVNFDSMAASAESRTLAVRATDSVERIEITNVLVGEVWLATGQSNMGIPLNSSPNARKEIAKASHSDFRYCVVTAGVAETPQLDLPVARHPELQKQPSTWIACSPASAPGFSGVAYFFGINLQNELKVPIGIMRSSVGGTPAQAWISRSKLESTAAGRSEIAEWDKKLADPEADRALYDKETIEAKEKAKASHKTPEIYAYQDPVKGNRRPANLYNAMIAPIAPFAFRGVIWYQGESNTKPIARAQQYHELFTSLIEDWRKLWSREFPFLFVQLPNFHGGNRVDWAALRESQAQTLALPKTGMAVAIDVGSTATIHPPDKRPVGYRLMLQALKNAYGRNIVADGPIFKAVQLNGNRAVISFKQKQKLISKSGENLTGFFVASENKKFVPARAKIAGNTVEVWSQSDMKISAVRYCFINSPDASLFNSDELPAAPFRTDNWPLSDLPGE